MTVASPVDPAEFMAAYVAEMEEHLSGAVARMLSIEAALARQSSEPRAVRDLYRALHTIKGLSAMVGVESVVAIAHRLENLVRAADRAGGSLSSNALEGVFDGVQTIEKLISALSSGDFAPQAPNSLLQRLDSIPTTESDQAAATPALDLPRDIERRLVAFEREELRRGLRDGQRVLQVDFVPSPERASRGITISKVRERVGAMAKIVKVVPLSAQGTDGNLRFVLLLVTPASDAEIAEAVDGHVSQVQPIRELSTPLAPLPETEADMQSIDLDLGRKNLLRVDVERVDDTLEIVSGLIINRSRMAQAISALSAAGFPTGELTNILQETVRQHRELRSAVLAIRTIAFAEVLARLPLVLHELRRSSKKQVQLVMDAAGAELDKAVAEKIFPALVHLLRNAVDHGIESPEARVRSGKSAHGTVSIECAMGSHRELEIRVRDDGKGIDRASVASAAAMPVESDAELLEAICRSGLSTRSQASTTSGRGMGMDIVKKTVNELKGELSVSSREAEGTLFILTIPLTVSILDALTVECENQRFAVPIASIEEIVEIDASMQLTHAPAEQGTAITMLARRGEAVPLVALSRALGRPTAVIGRHVLIVRRGTEPIGFTLDRVLSQHEAVVRPLTDPLVQAPGVAGATDLGDGQATIVLDLLALAAALKRETSDPAECAS